MSPPSPRVFAVLGDPVAHSLSPAMHNAAFRVLGLDAVYVPLRCRAEDTAALLRALAYAGGGGNVTVPHKAAAAAASDRCTALAERLGAVNTFWGENGTVHGDNTDVAGVLEALHELDAPAGAWLVCGTGGAARAVAAAAAERGAALAVRSRAEDRRRRFTAWLGELGVTAAEPGDAVVVINATPLGLAPGDALPVPPAELPRRSRVGLDLVYARGETRWTRALRAAGLRAADGRTMLVAQGAAAFERWFAGRRAPRDAMRAAVDAALR